MATLTMSLRKAREMHRLESPDVKKGENMKIITISREFGSGGRELGKRLADLFACDYYDKEIITFIAANKGLDENYVARAMDQHGWQNIPLNFRQSLAGLTMHSAQTDLLLEQKRVIEQIAKTGKDCVIVGRNADVLLREYQPFNMFVCAGMEVKIRRCMDAASEEERLNTKEMLRKIKRIDRSRSQVRELVTDMTWGDRLAYHLTINTTTWEIKDLTPVVAEFIKCWYERAKE